MQPDNLIATGMILLLFATVGVIAAFGKLPQNRISWQWRIICSLPTGFITFVILPLKFIYKCEESSIPSNQSLLAALCVMTVVIFIPQKWLATLCCLVALIAGYELCSQFHYIVNRTGSYAYKGQLNGLTYNYPCPDSWSKPVKTRSSWHSFFTGIYKVD